MIIIIIITIIIIAKLWSILELISVQNCVIQKLIKTNELISNEDLFKRLLRVAGFFLSYKLHKKFALGVFTTSKYDPVSNTVVI